MCVWGIFAGEGGGAVDGGGGAVSGVHGLDCHHPSSLLLEELSTGNSRMYASHPERQ